METLKKIYSKLWKANYVIEFFAALIFMFSLFNVLYMKKINNIWSLKDLILSALTIPFIIFIIIQHIRINRDKLEKIFLCIAIPLSIAYMVFVLPFLVPDEGPHVFRSFNMARGNIIVSKEENEESVPVEFYNLENTKNKYTDLIQAKADNIHANTDGNEAKKFNQTVTYFPIVYIGPTIAGVIGNILNLNIINLVYLMRISNIIIYLVLGYFTIKCIPFGKLLMLTYLCIPMMLHQAASASADVLINAATLLFIAYNMKLLFSKEKKYSLKEKIIYFVLALLATLNKVAYMPLVFIAILLPFSKKNPKSKNDKIFMILTIIIMVALTGIWYLFGAGYKDTRELIIQRNVSSSAQLDFVKSHPLTFVNILFNTLDIQKTSYLYEALGSLLGYLDIPVDTLVCTLYLILLVFAPFLEKSKYRLKNLHKIWLLLITFGIICLVCFAMYLGWTVPTSLLIDGVQGRYFLPVLILPLLCLIQKNNYLKFKNTIPFYAFMICFLNYYALLAVFKFFIAT